MQGTPTPSPADAPTGGTSLLHDPQFWLATMIALAAAAFLLRGLLPRLGLRAQKPDATKATLTVGGKSIKK